LSALFALAQKDLKRFAYSTISQIGHMVLTGIERSGDSRGLFHCLNHGLFKGSVFVPAPFSMPAGRGIWTV
jgi:NADH:ubiquinone oxidoreductase subunit 5 (subunit L)/multisubunit Na+/H+ antiporter MnhA subunit